MARNLTFTPSKGGGLHASTYVEFRISAEQLAWAFAEKAVELGKSPRLVTKGEAEKLLRRDLFISGYGYFDIERYVEVEEQYGEALDHVKAVYKVEG